MFSRILLASDGSDDANRAADAAASLAERFGAQLHVLHIFPLMPHDPALTAVSPFKGADDTVRDVVAHWAVESEQTVERRVGQVLREHRIPYTFHQENGDPAAVIVQVAAREGFDLIVIGCRGLGPALCQQLGSVSDWVSRHAPCPVLIIRPLHTNLSPTTP